MPAPEKIKQLVQTFEQNLNEYHTRKNETELRRQFLDPFFEALGWDVSNNKGNDERRKEVAHELSVEIDGQQKKADYAFRTGIDKFDFLVEAKKPSVKIESDPKSAFQVKRYGWSAKLPINVLTDFEHFAVYDCRVKPNYKDKVTAGRVHLFHYKDYIEKWDEIAALFSPDAIRTGALDEFTEGLKTKKGTADVDDDFLAEIERWRDLLARNIANRNKDKGLTENQLNYAVQMTIDRIVFLRIAEERGMEEYGRLQNLIEDGDIYSHLKQYFLKADERYNSGLFHFKVSKKTLRDSESLRVSTPDTVTFNLQIDDKVLEDIIENLYEPKSPYAFAYIPADILGSVYERFLGKVIRLTAGGQAKVEDKPEVRKAGGVYYTPVYVVEYIVKNTVGKLLGESGVGTLRGESESRYGTEEHRPYSTTSKTPKEVAEIKVVDPACGSGSFLLGAYQYLLNWHLDWYTQNDPDKHLKNKVLLTQDNKTYRLSMNEKKRILLNNIHGVDVDPQAVEVTKLSLLLKVVEDPGQLTMFEEGHILPDLGNNIKCGNSLIGMDYFEGQLMADAEETARVNPFDWKSAFPAVFKRGGFDAVIGNPPYGADFDKKSEAYIRNRYHAITNSLDSFIMFVEQAGSLLKPQGNFGMIIPSGWVSTPSSKKLRERFVEQFRPTSFVSLPYDVFDGAYVDTIIVTAQRLVSGKIWTDLEDTAVDLIVFPIRRKIKEQKDFDEFRTIGSFADWIETPDKEFLVLSSKEQANLIKKLRGSPATLDSVVEVMRGIETYHPRPAKECQNPMRAFNGEMLRYKLDIGPEAYEGYPPDIEAGKSIKFFSGQRILLRQLISRKFRLQAVYSDEQFLTNQSVQSLIPRNATPNIKCILAILNSRLISWFFCQVNMVARRDDFPKIIIKQTRGLPFPRIDFNNPDDKAKHDQMVTLVERMLALHKSLASAKTPQEKESMQRQVESTDGAIDKLVYELYGLTEEEIGIVEGK